MVFFPDTQKRDTHLLYHNRYYVNVTIISSVLLPLIDMRY